MKRLFRAQTRRLNSQKQIVPRSFQRLRRIDRFHRILPLKLRDYRPGAQNRIAKPIVTAKERRVGLQDADPFFRSGADIHQRGDQFIFDRKSPAEEGQHDRFRTTAKDERQKNRLLPNQSAGFKSDHFRAQIVPLLQPPRFGTVRLGRPDGKIEPVAKLVFHFAQDREHIDAGPGIFRRKTRTGIRLDHHRIFRRELSIRQLSEQAETLFGERIEPFVGPVTTQIMTAHPSDERRAKHRKRDKAKGEMRRPKHRVFRRPMPRGH